MGRTKIFKISKAEKTEKVEEKMEKMEKESEEKKEAMVIGKEKEEVASVGVEVEEEEEDESEDRSNGNVVRMVQNEEVSEEERNSPSKPGLQIPKNAKSDLLIDDLFDLSDAE